ncbi:hypothetical protein HA402_003770 [Bradysia odoriphaga]|nr:hypothetical protein HA402_003770 [Bradysia odoriphaga]
MDLLREGELSIPNFDELTPTSHMNQNCEKTVRKPRNPRNKDGPKRARTAFSAKQIAQLERAFTESSYLTTIVLLLLSEEMGLPEANIKTWFQNRRKKAKLAERARCQQISSTSSTSASSIPSTSTPNAQWSMVNPQLERAFTESAYLTTIIRLQLSEEMGLPEATIKSWFQNRRMKAKLAKRAQHRLQTLNGRWSMVTPFTMIAWIFTYDYNTNATLMTTRNRIDGNKNSHRQYLQHRLQTLNGRWSMVTPFTMIAWIFTYDYNTNATLMTTRNRIDGNKNSSAGEGVHGKRVLNHNRPPAAFGRNGPSGSNHKIMVPKSADESQAGKTGAAWFMACVLFTAPTPNPGEFYCHQPDNNLPSDGIMIHKTHRPMTLQKDLYDMDFCHTYNRTHNGEFEEDILVPCTSFHFDSVVETAVTKFSLVCSRSILISVAQLSHLIGVLTGGIFANIIMETMSPRKLLLCGMWTQIIAGCLASYVPHNYIHLMILRYLAAVCCSQMYTAGQVIFTDITGGIHRSIAICLFESFWSIGVILLPMIAYIDPNWSSIFFMISLPTVLYIPLWFLIPDSPTWYLKKNRVDKAEDIIRKGARTNNTQHLLPNDLRQRLLAQMTSNSKEPLVTEWCSLWLGRRTVLQMLALHIAWCVCVTNYNGLLLNVKAFGRDYLSENTIALAPFIGALSAVHQALSLSVFGILNIIGGFAMSILSSPKTFDRKGKESESDLPNINVPGRDF